MWPDTKMKLITIGFLVLLYFSQTNCFLDRSSSNTRDYQLRTSDFSHGVERLKDLRSRRIDERRLHSREAFRNLDDRESLDRNNNIVRWQRILPDRSSRSVDVRNFERDNQHSPRSLKLACPKPTRTDNFATIQQRNEGRFSRLSNRLTFENTYKIERSIQRHNRRDIPQDYSNIFRRKTLESREDRIDESRFSSRYYRRSSEEDINVNAVRERTSESRTDVEGRSLRSSENRSAFKRSDKRYDERNIREIDSNIIQRRTSESKSDRNDRFRVPEITPQSRRNRVITTSSSPVTDRRLSQNEDNFNTQRSNKRRQIRNDRERNTQTIERLLESRADRQRIDRRLTENRSSFNSDRSYERRQNRNALKIDPNSIQRRIAELRLSRNDRSRNSETFDERSSQAKTRDSTGTERRKREMTNTVRIRESRINQVERRTSFPVTRRRLTLENRYRNLNSVERRENRDSINRNINLPSRSVSESEIIRDRRSVRENLQERRNIISNSARLRTQEFRLSRQTLRNRIRHVERQPIRNFEERRVTALPTTDDRITTPAQHSSRRTLGSANDRIPTYDERTAQRRLESLNLERERRSDRIGESRSAQRSRRTDTTSTRNALTESRRSQNRDATSILRVKRDARSLEDRTYFTRTKPEIIRKQSNKLVPPAIQFRNEHMQTKMEQQSSPADRTVLRRQRLNSERDSKSRRSLERERQDRQSIEFVNNGNSLEEKTLSERRLLNHIVTFENDKSRTSIGSTPKMFFSSKPNYENSPTWLNIAKVVFLSVSIVQILCASDPKLFRNKFLNIFTLHKEKVH